MDLVLPWCNSTLLAIVVDCGVGEPAVSILVPVYNVERYLRAALASAMRQTIDDWEIVCVDDGSTDGSLKILQDHAARDARIRVISQKNFGTLHARVTAIRAAKGRFILFLDGDDFLERDIARQALAVADAERMDVVQFMVRMRKNCLSFLRIPAWLRRISLKWGNVYRQPQLLPIAVYGGFGPFIYDKLIRRSVAMAAVGDIPSELLGARITYCEDLFFATVVAKHARSWKVIPRAGYRYIRRPASVTRSCDNNFLPFKKRFRDMYLQGRVLEEIIPKNLHFLLGDRMGNQFAGLFWYNGFNWGENLNALTLVLNNLSPSYAKKILSHLLQRMYTGSAWRRVPSIFRHIFRSWRKRMNDLAIRGRKLLFCLCCMHRRLVNRGKVAGCGPMPAANIQKCDEGNQGKEQGHCQAVQPGDGTVWKRPAP
jgi:glycosyltransferase involved in cell wall biosynthesis